MLRNMQRTLLVGMLLTLAVVGGAVKKKEPKTLVGTRTIRLLSMPTQGYESYKPGDVILIGSDAQIVEAREITLWCGGYALSISPLTSVAHITCSWTGTVRSRAAIDPHSSVVGVADGTM